MKKTMLILLSLCLCASALLAQGFPASGTQSGGEMAPVTLGQSVVGLTGPWKFKIGVSPIRPQKGVVIHWVHGINSMKAKTDTPNLGLPSRTHQPAIKHPIRAMEPEPGAAGRPRRDPALAQTRTPD
jgi:hypothetical protein